jgi:hypothetical protein
MKKILDRLVEASPITIFVLLSIGLEATRLIFEAVTTAPLFCGSVFTGTPSIFVFPLLLKAIAGTLLLFLLRNILHAFHAISTWQIFKPKDRKRININSTIIAIVTATMLFGYTELYSPSVYCASSQILVGIAFMFIFTLLISIKSNKSKESLQPEEK